MFDYDINVNSIRKLDTVLKRVNKMLDIVNSDEFKEYIKQKVLELLEDEQKYLVGDEDDENVIIKSEHVSIYKASHHTEDVAGGFILYNDAVVVAETSHPENYEGGIFPLALAIEYGTGIVAEVGSYSAGVFEPWEYNVHEYNGYWVLPDGRLSSGNEPYEIYSNVALKTVEQYGNWVTSYLKEKGGI